MYFAIIYHVSIYNRNYISEFRIFVIQSFLNVPFMDRSLTINIIIPEKFLFKRNFSMIHQIMSNYNILHFISCIRKSALASI